MMDGVSPYEAVAVSNLVQKGMICPHVKKLIEAKGCTAYKIGVLWAESYMCHDSPASFSVISIRPDRALCMRDNKAVLVDIETLSVLPSNGGGI